METKYAIELINQNKDREITFSSLEGSKPVFIEDEEEAIQTAREEASSSYNCSYDAVLVNEYEINEDEPDEYQYTSCIAEFEVEYNYDGSAKFRNISHDELVRDIDGIVGDLEKTYSLDKGEDFFSWWQDERITDLTDEFDSKVNFKSLKVRIKDYDDMLDKVYGILEEEVMDAVNGDFREYYNAFGEVFGISFKDGEPIYVKKFISMDKAEKWLDTEESDYRDRELLSEKEVMRTLKLKSREELDNMIRYYLDTTYANAQSKASVKYDKKNTKSISLKLNKNTDADILEKFEECDNVSQYLKQLVRQDIKK